eukprot:TRINITY_DN92274_c0_g1_i1.p1 TRINITY_DN92274_c0_g1~~TRINITY_DN92274_c0_g1_i1.p1  ORF type:complete len:206 (-),score=25.57 TRINITY_DN92274_c0_g1_i1:38-655(-)
MGQNCGCSCPGNGNEKVHHLEHHFTTAAHSESMVLPNTNDPGMTVHMKMADPVKTDPPFLEAKAPAGVQAKLDSKSPPETKLEPATAPVAVSETPSPANSKAEPSSPAQDATPASAPGDGRFARFEGTWQHDAEKRPMGIITSSGMLKWAAGFNYPDTALRVEQIGPGNEMLHMELSGEGFKGQLTAPDTLEWSDGDVWVRVSAN